MTKTNQPKLTPAALIALTASVLEVVTAFGVHLTTAQHDAIEHCVQTALAVVATDTILRIARNLTKHK